MELKLSAEVRAKDEKLEKDLIPGVVYGRGLESRSLKLNYNAFAKVFAEAGESNLITLNLGGKDIPVLVKATQKHPLKSTYTHIDFYEVNMKEEVKAEVPLEFIGESKVVKEGSGIFSVIIDQIGVECLPGDLVDHIDVDISVLAEFGDAIRLSDIVLPKGMTLMQDDTAVVCMVEEPNKVEEVVKEEVVEEKDAKASEGEVKEEEEKK
ncbi:MAG: 50S ribosomal protein L25 [Patescibacteria group bacterium]|nr:50S ribosomal protein L25 [Patescibacteria group bacterium]